MNYRVLGRTGLKVSELCLGTMTFGENFFNIAVVDQLGANTMVARALDAGINFFDTADVYSYGRSEEVLGAALKDVAVGRDKVIIATKVRSAMSEAASQGDSGWATTCTRPAAIAAHLLQCRPSLRWLPCRQ